MPPWASRVNMVFVVGMEEQRRMEVGGGSRVAGVPGPGDARGVEKLVVQHHHPQSRLLPTPLLPPVIISQFSDSVILISQFVFFQI